MPLRSGRLRSPCILTRNPTLNSAADAGTLAGVESKEWPDEAMEHEELDVDADASADADADADAKSEPEPEPGPELLFSTLHDAEATPQLSNSPSTSSSCT